MYKIITGTQYEPEVSNIFEAKKESAELLFSLDIKMIYVYLKDALVMIAEKMNDSVEYHEIAEDDNFGVIYE